MKYIRNYHSFIRESKKQIGKNALVVEKQVLNEFSSDFWGLCLRSSIFTNEEKVYIENNLSNKKVSLLNEEGEWLDKAVDWAKDKGEKMLGFVSDKIKSIKNGLKDFVSSMVAFAKKILMSGLNAALTQAKKFKQKVTGDGKFKENLKNIDPEKSKEEFEDFVKTIQFWAPGKSAAEAKPSVDKAGGQIESKIKSAEGEAISSTEKNLTEAEDEAKNESVSTIIYSTNDDVLESFYNLSLIKEAEESKDGEKKTTGQKCIDWILGFLGQDKMDPDAKAGKKLFWWGKLFLKVLSTCLSPILKIVESLVKTGANLALKGVSMVTGALGGPGAFQFAVLGGLCGGIVGIIYDSLMLFGDGGESTGADTMAVVKKWLAHAINESLELFASYKTLKYIFAGFCAAMTLWHVIEELAHLNLIPEKLLKVLVALKIVSAHGHGHEGEHGEEHKEGEHKEGEEAKPGTPAKPGDKEDPAKPAPGAPAAKPAVA
jgi:hypothetical protein